MLTTVSSVPSAPARTLTRMVVCWILLLPLLYLAAQGEPSFDRADQNVSAGTGESHYETYASQKLNSGTESIRKKIELLIVYSLVAGTIWPYARRFKPVLLRNKLLLLLPGFALLSTLWSQTPFTTFEASIGVTLIMLLGVYVSLRFEHREQIQLFLTLSVVFVALSLFLVLFVPSVGIDRFYGSTVWQGICNHKNKFATMVVYLLAPCLFYEVRTREKKLLLLGFTLLSFVCEAMSQARTGWLLLACSLALVVFVKMQPSFTEKQRLLSILGLLGVAVLSVWVAFAYYPELAVLLGKDSTLTGRTEIYRNLIAEAIREPLWGYGFVAFFTGKGEWLSFALKSGLTGLGNAENPVLQIWLELGLIGVACLSVSLFQAGRNVITCLVHHPSRYVQWCTLLVCLNFFALLGGDKIMFPHTLQWLLYVLGYVGLSAEAQRIRKLKAL